MHQPYYKHPDENYYVLPWVRLHAVKDYYGMAKTVEKFEKIKVAFNFSGILLHQLFDYVNNRAEDYYSMLSLRDAQHLDKKEKDFIVRRFFSINFERFILNNRRYHQLYNKKMSSPQRFDAQEISDIMALFNLCWFHPYTIRNDKNLKDLIRKGRYYTTDDRAYIINKQYEVISEIFPLYRKLVKENKVELTVTPYHHPIMPLIYDTDILKDTPYLKMPAHRFSLPSDCRWHLQKSKELFKDIFGKFPQGSWPSEGSVSEPVCDIYAQEKFDWIATDEAILFKSLAGPSVSYDMIKQQRRLIYHPYKFKDISIFFRDRNLSDAISFTYQGWEDPVFAANDLLEHFKKTHYHLKGIFKENVISIIMDGENAWEYYKNNAVEFLETIYSALEKSSILSSTLPSEFLAGFEPKNLDRLASGSWINGDFGVWIGSEKNNSYWQLLNQIKALFKKHHVESDKLNMAKDYFHLIEGSDWFWWNTFEDIEGEFKKIFFSYVEKIYSLLGGKFELPAINKLS